MGGWDFRCGSVAMPPDVATPPFCPYKAIYKCLLDRVPEEEKETNVQ